MFISILENLPEEYKTSEPGWRDIKRKKKAGRLASYCALPLEDSLRITAKLTSPSHLSRLWVSATSLSFQLAVTGWKWLRLCRQIS